MKSYKNSKIYAALHQYSACFLATSQLRNQRNSQLPNAGNRSCSLSPTPCGWQADHSGQFVWITRWILKKYMSGIHAMDRLGSHKLFEQASFIEYMYNANDDNSRFHFIMSVRHPCRQLTHPRHSNSRCSVRQSERNWTLVPLYFTW